LMRSQRKGAGQSHEALDRGEGKGE
jgi:hypothetical protein